MLDQALNLFAPLVGACFTATIGPGLTDTHCFEQMFDGKHVQDQHVVSKDGKAAYAGMSTYSATPEGLFFTYVNSTGGSGTGTATPTTAGFTYRMTMRADAMGASKPYEGSWAIRADGYDVAAPGEPVRRFVRVANGDIR